MRSPYIVVVDDDDGMSLALKRLLRSEGMEVFTVSSGKEVLGTLRTRRADCVVMDIELQDFKDLDLFDAIQEENRGLPVIAVTAWVDDTLRRRFLERGGFGFLYKPFLDHRILGLINGALDLDWNDWRQEGQFRLGERD